MLKSRVEPAVRRHVPGEPGIWIFILGDMGIFLILFLTYLHSRSADPALFDTSQRELNQAFGVVNTLLLLTSSLFVAAGVQATRVGRTTMAPRLFLGGFVLGFAFIGSKVIEYHQKYGDGITPSTDHFFMYYYAMTGLHLLHVVTGLGILLYLMVRSRSPRLKPIQLAFVEGGACFWHMVDLLWIVIFPLLYLAK
jgi:nitric oxide reductase NorE protein